MSVSAALESLRQIEHRSEHQLRVGELTCQPLTLEGGERHGMVVSR
jgi:hypothetical protein